MELVDYSFLEELSENDPQYIYNILDIFLGSVPEGMDNLKAYVSANDWENIYKQSHALKSSFSIIKVSDMYDWLAGIESLAMNRSDSNKIQELFTLAETTFSRVKPAIERKREDYKVKSST